MRGWLWLLGSLWSAWLAAAEPLLIRHMQLAAGDTRDPYVMQLLNAALEATAADYGPWQLQPVVGSHQARSFRLLAQGELDLAWGMTSEARENEALPVRVPLMAGLLGYRVLLIRPADQPIFTRVRRLSDLASFSAVQGHDWPDASILGQAGLKVASETDYPTMFRLVAQGLVDYFPRGVLEAWAEQQSALGSGLAVEQRLLLVYPAADYFFVARDNPALAQRLELGLQRLIASGRFDELLFGFPAHREALAQARLAERLQLRLVNPLMPPTMPLSEPTLWFSEARYQRWLTRAQPPH